MSITKTPSFAFGYWRPWNENSNFSESYLDYARDISLETYSANTIGNYISQASKEQVQSINQLGSKIGRGMNVLANKMTNINFNLQFINRNIDIQIEQQKLSNLLLKNIAELLRVPDSEKERQHCIELGIKFFVNAKKDSDLYADSLEELLKAESLMRQDYFVLHRIGYIYLYVEKFINPQKALDYFLRAAKYASVESDPKAVRLANILTSNINVENDKISSSVNRIGLLAGESYEKAAFASYILGQFENAVDYQTKALSFNPSVENRFLLSKYQVRNGRISEALENLNSCIDNSPTMLLASFKEIDLINEPEIIKLIDTKNKDINSKIDDLIEKWKTLDSINAQKVVAELNQLLQDSYEVKVSGYNNFYDQGAEIHNDKINIENAIDEFIDEIKTTVYTSFDEARINASITELTAAKSLPYENMKQVYESIVKQHDSDKLKIGSFYAGGIVFFIDETGKHGLVCTYDIGYADWGGAGYIGAIGNGISAGIGIENTKKIVNFSSWYEKKGFFSVQKPAPTSARLCLELRHGGFNDWYLPTKQELEFIYLNLYKNDIGNFKQTESFWSSTEFDDSKACQIIFFKDSVRWMSENKWMKCRVRAVRSF